jgi:hypothetical protein
VSIVRLRYKGSNFIRCASVCNYSHLTLNLLLRVSCGPVHWMLQFDQYQNGRERIAMRRDARPTSGLKKKFFRVEWEMKRKGEIRVRIVRFTTKTRWGIEQTMVLGGTTRWSRIVFFPCGFWWSKPIPDALIDDTCSIGWLKMS